jgi:NAD dependent epimerase/dehydratase family enzyme
MLHLLTADVEGPVNLTAPEPATNATFATTLGRVLHRPAVVPIPAFGPRLVLGRDLADALLVPTRLLESGFVFAHAELDVALRHVLGR